MGKLYFYYSAINAGKTTTLLQSAFNYNERGMNILLFTPTIDDRYGAGLITSRIGLQAAATSFDTSFDFYDHIQPIVGAYSCILVDEAQFLLKAQVHQLARVIDDFNIPVLAYGIRTDFRGEPFEGAQYLLAWADEIVEIKTICHCGRKATFNARIDERGNMEMEGAQIEIGGNNRYVSLCRKHFKQGVTCRQVLVRASTPTAIIASAPCSPQKYPSIVHPVPFIDDDDIGGGMQRCDSGCTMNE